MEKNKSKFGFGVVFEKNKLLYVYKQLREFIKNEGFGGIKYFPELNIFFVVTSRMKGISYYLERLNKLRYVRDIIFDSGFSGKSFHPYS